MSGEHNWHLVIFLVAVVALASSCDSGKQPTAQPQIDSASQSADALSADDSRGGNGEATAGEPEKPVVAESLPYAEVDDQLVYGHFAFPADMVDPLPGVIVIHERWGLDDSVRALADRIAGHGYVVLAVDLYGGVTASNAADARTLMVEVFENPGPADENIRQAYQFLIDSGEAPRIGALGWSFGGSWALNTAMLFPDDLDAAVVYYGQVTDNEERLAPIKAPILGLFGDKDRGVSIETVRSFETALENLGKTYDIEVYPGVGHAFADPRSTNYDHDAAESAWSQTLNFLDKYLVADKN
jgi:carboxymethylenebutenolidase